MVVLWQAIGVIMTAQSLCRPAGLAGAWAPIHGYGEAKYSSLATPNASHLSGARARDYSVIGNTIPATIAKIRTPVIVRVTSP
jgi:hypothetical protein